MATLFECEVRFPQKKENSFTTKKRLPVLKLSDGEREESWTLPLRVAKVLDSQIESGEFCPASRAELAYKVKTLSQTVGKTRLAELIDKRDYSAHEALKKLVGDGYSHEVSQELVDRAVQCGLIDDVRFAKSFIRFKLSCGWGAKKISYELARRGVDVKEVPGWPEEFFEDESEYELAYKAASKKRITGKNDYQKIVRFLGGRGFSFGIASSVARQILNEFDNALDGQ